MFVLSDLDILTIATVVEIAITAQQGPVRQKDLRARYHLAARFPRAELTGACTRRHSQKHTRTLGGYAPARTWDSINLANILSGLGVRLSDLPPLSRSGIARNVVSPALQKAEDAYFARVARRHGTTGEP